MQKKTKKNKTKKKTLSFDEQITSKDTYTSICSHQMEAIEFITRG